MPTSRALVVGASEATAPSPHKRHRALVDAIERDFRVADWRAGDVDLWPIASQDLFLDLFRSAGGDTAPAPSGFAARAATTLATPALNLWRSRRDLAHWLPRPRRADAILLGDGVSLDHIGGAWRDRFGEPVVAALERQGRSCFVMQNGNLARLPWARPTFAANRLSARAALVTALTSGPAIQLPDHAAVMRFLDAAGVNTPSLAPERLAHRARSIATRAAVFERILRRVRPGIAFVVTYYAGLGCAFALACRRRGILCVDLQHCPHDGMHRAYRWSTLPPRGYSTLPGLFWSWSVLDAADIHRWADTLAQPWHRAIPGGHTQIAALHDGVGEQLWQKTAAIAGDRPFVRDILVALQPIGGRRQVWAALADAITSAPSDWRWWIRRHPASTPPQDADCAPLLTMCRPNVIITGASQTPLPALLGHMTALVSLASGSAGEAAMFGVPAFFLDDEARDTFPGLIASGKARVVEIGALIAAIARLPTGAAQRAAEPMPRIEDTLGEIDRLAADYARLCRETDHVRLAAMNNEPAATH